MLTFYILPDISIAEKYYFLSFTKKILINLIIRSIDAIHLKIIFLIWWRQIIEDE